MSTACWTKLLSHAPWQVHLMLAKIRKWAPDRQPLLTSCFGLRDGCRKLHTCADVSLHRCEELHSPAQVLRAFTSVETGPKGVISSKLCNLFRQI